MQSAETILSLLGQKMRENPDFVFHRLYRYLFNSHLYTIGLKHEDCKQDQLQHVDQLIHQLRYERYRPGCKHCDTLLIRGVLKLLKAIYQPQALPSAKASIPEALWEVRQLDPPYGWLIENRAVEFFHHIQPEQWVPQCKKRMDDGRWLTLLQQLVQYHLPIRQQLISIVLHELDQWMLSFQETVRYVRFQDQLFLLVQGSKSMARAIQAEMDQWLKTELKLMGFSAQTQIRRFIQQPMMFLGCELRANASDHRIRLFVPKQVIQQRLQPFMKKQKAVAHSARIHLPVERIISLYRQEWNALQAEYAWAENKKQLKRFRYIHGQSLLKTLARKHNCSVNQVQQKHPNVIQRYLT